MFVGSSRLVVVLTGLALALAGCSKGKVEDNPRRDLGGGGPDGYTWPDRGGPDTGSLPRDGATLPKDGPRPDTLQPDTLRPDVLAPDVLAPDVLAPDILAPDTMPQGSFKAPFTLDFESSGGGLTATKDWEWGTLNFNKGSGCTSNISAPTKAHSGSKLWGTILNDCHSAPGNDASGSCSSTANASTADDSVLTLGVTIPSLWTTATLSYWQWHDGFLSYDWGEIRINNKVTTQFCSGTPPGSTGIWEKVSVDLSSHTGKTVKITFHFVASTSVNHAGWYIDDLSVSGI
jgi:hypothetical protein